MEKGKTPFCAKIGVVMSLLIFKIQCTHSGGGGSILMNDQVFILKVKPYLESGVELSYDLLIPIVPKL
jgi:hypothetical protein